MSETTKRGPGWQPGTSGNPAGRPRGRGEPARLRETLAAALPEILAQLVARAKVGDMNAIRAVLERVLPPIKATEQLVSLSLPAGTSLADTGRALVAAAAAGQLAPGQASAMVAALAALSRVVEVEELMQRVEALEGRGEGPP